MEQVEPAIVKLSVADRCHFFICARERCSSLLAEIHEELPSPEALRCGEPFRVIRVFNRPVFQPAGDIRPGDALATIFTGTAGGGWRNLQVTNSNVKIQMSKFKIQKI